MNLIVLKCNWRQSKSSRTLALPADWTLYDLHQALQAAFGWFGEHLYMFKDEDGTRWEEEDPFDDIAAFEEDGHTLPPAGTTIGEAFPDPKRRLDYIYDFGDSNEVRLVRQKDVEGDGPACLKASGLMAEEDSAGVGYADGIAAILTAGPEDGMYADLADWLGIESLAGAKQWIEDHTARADEITFRLKHIMPIRRKKTRRKK